MELDINAGSIRLIANAVIYYNATILSKLYEYYLSSNQEKSKEISRLSPVAWQHISFVGKYEFYNRINNFNIQEVIEFLLEKSEIGFSLETQPQ